MINWKSILSSYDDKPTLLQWLKMVKKALDESVLETVSVEQPTDTTAVLSFNFADGTSIKAPAITLPRGVQGVKGDKGTEIVSMTVYHTEVVGGKTNTAINVQYSDHPSDTFTVSAQNGKDGAKGADGANGVSITGIDTVSDEVVGDETLTTLRAHYSNGTNDEVVVTAKNGKDGAKSYKHAIVLAVYEQTGKEFHINLITTSPVPITLDNVYTLFSKFVSGYIVEQRDLTSFPIKDASYNTTTNQLEIAYIGANFATSTISGVYSAIMSVPFDTVTEL